MKMLVHRLREKSLTRRLILEIDFRIREIQIGFGSDSAPIHHGSTPSRLDLLTLQFLPNVRKYQEFNMNSLQVADTLIIKLQQIQAINKITRHPVGTLLLIICLRSTITEGSDSKILIKLYRALNNQQLLLKIIRTVPSAECKQNRRE